MEGMTLKSRAIAFAFCVGAVSFILALFAGAQGDVGDYELIRAVVIAIVCGVMSWASAERSVAGHAEAVDSAIERLSRAAEGDLVSPTPDKVAACLPDLARSMDGLLMQVRSNLENVHSLAMFDPVTQLPNRTYFRREAARVLREVPDTIESAMFFIDLDKFKNVNDSLGHAQGDQLLARVANRLRAVIEPEPGKPSRFPRAPLLGRLAGDEFTMLVPEVPSREEAERIGRALLYALAEPFDIAGQSVEIGASIGLAMRPEQGRTLSELMRAADVAMYHAKERGRGQVQSFTPALAARLADNVRLEAELRAAVERREFTFVFQPQLDLPSGKMVGAEALLRWNHPVFGLRMPDSFVPRAEESGLIHEIGLWATEELAGTLARWRRIGAGGRLAVNVSPRQLARPDYFLRVRDAMMRHGSPPDLLELEVTESIAMQCGDEALAELASLRRQGVSVALDDFGTGYSNLARLKDLPIDRAKIDRSLIADIANSDEARTIAHAVIGLVHGLGYQVVAEGVETEDQIAILRVIGADIVQGFAIARPMTEVAFLEWLSKRGPEGWIPTIPRARTKE